MSETRDLDSDDLRASFKEQLRLRSEEFEELEEVVQKYSRSLKVQSLLKGNMIKAFRMGIIECMHYLDQKAQNQALERSMKEHFLTEGG